MNSKPDLTRLRIPLRLEFRACLLVFEALVATGLGPRGFWVYGFWVLSMVGRFVLQSSLLLNQRVGLTPKCL